MPEDAPAIDPAAYRTVLGRFPTGVTVITTTDEGASTGLAIGSFFSISLDPPLVGFCVGSGSASWQAIRHAGHFTVNVLSDLQGNVSAQFASKKEDKFEGIDHHPGVTGDPRINGCLAYMDCTLDADLEGGDHAIVIGRVQALELGAEGGPLVFFKGGYGRFGQLD